MRRKHVTPPRRRPRGGRSQRAPGEFHSFNFGPDSWHSSCFSFSLNFLRVGRAPLRLTVAGAPLPAEDDVAGREHAGASTHEEWERAAWRAWELAMQEEVEASTKAWEDTAVTRKGTVDPNRVGDAVWVPWEADSPLPPSSPRWHAEAVQGPAQPTANATPAGAEAAGRSVGGSHEPAIPMPRPSVIVPATALGRGNA